MRSTFKKRRSLPAIPLVLGPCVVVSSQQSLQQHREYTHNKGASSSSDCPTHNPKQRIRSLPRWFRVVVA
uniref:Putative secreted peptide n=1 Tax=Anopheles braziliensis TaxID=58242 RepID=A0A2M3ZWD1_9DIPT